MGGQLFATPGPNNERGLHVPRMSPSTYETLKAKFIEFFSEYFITVGVPREAPGKLDHGDLDIMVEGTKEPNVRIAYFKEKLGAVRTHANGPTWSFAIPHPDMNDAFVQLDLHKCAPGNFEWEYFMNSYSDLWQILGFSFRSLGLTSNDKGLHLRIAEIDQSEKKRRMLFLTKDPREVLAFLGLDVEMFETGFESEEQLFRWIAESRFFHPDLLADPRDTANDRQRKKKRGQFKRFLEDWFPANMQAEQSNKLWTREQVAAEALRTFGKQAEYDERIAESHLDLAETELWKKITVLLQNKGFGKARLGLALRALRRWTSISDGQLTIRNVPVLEHWPRWIDQRGTMTDEDILNWIRLHWSEIMLLEQRRIENGKADRKLGSSLK
jgi:hypothetical protein